MGSLFADVSYPYVFGIVAATTLLRYLVFAGTTYLLFWVVFRSATEKRRIQKSYPPASHIWREVRYSLGTVALFALVGVGLHHAERSHWTLIYRDFGSRGWGYAALSLVLLLLIHDTYFYWAHRLMHHPKLYRFTHAVHHRSTNPSPWAALFFQPTEAVLEAAILPLAVLILPLHIYTIIAFLMLMMFLNTLGHLGVELYPQGFTRSRWTWWNNTATHHNMHHRYVNYNFGLYFNWWDRMMGTNHPRYHDVFDAVCSVPLRASPQDAAFLPEPAGIPGMTDTGNS